MSGGEAFIQAATAYCKAYDAYRTRDDQDICDEAHDVLIAAYRAWRGNSSEGSRTTEEET